MMVLAFRANAAHGFVTIIGKLSLPLLHKTMLSGHQMWWMVYQCEVCSKASLSLNEVIRTTAMRAPSSSGSTRLYADWETACIEMLQRLKRHEYVDPKRSGCIGNFFLPVIEVFPGIRESYLAVIDQPMDLGTIETRLLSNGMLDAEGFLEKVLLVFENAVKYNADHKESSYAIKLTKKCKHLVTYTKWLAYEILPLKNDANEVDPKALGDLRESLRDIHRAARFDLLKKPYHSMQKAKNLGGLGMDINDCQKLIRDLERKNNWDKKGGEKAAGGGAGLKSDKKHDKYLIQYFATPVDQKLLSDYAVYVRQPMDLSTVKAKLEAIPPHYGNYHEFIDDLRLIFSNSICYNKMHLETDTTGVSEIILQAALYFQAKLENLLLKDFSIDLCDKILKDDIESEELRKKQVSLTWDDAVHIVYNGFHVGDSAGEV